MAITETIVQATKIIGCDFEYYKNEAPKDTYYESTMYLVNNGTDVENAQPYTDLYYGSRKLSDICVVSTYPGNEEYLNDKIYLQYLNEDYTSNFVGNGTQQVFQLNNVSDIKSVTIDGVEQSLITNYTYNTANNTITFKVAPIEGANIEVTYTDGVIHGYRLYFKHNNLVIPIGTSAYIADVDIDQENSIINVVWNTDSGELLSTKLLIADDSGELPQSLYNSLYAKLHNELVSQVKNTKWEDIGNPISYENITNIFIYSDSYVFPLTNVPEAANTISVKLNNNVVLDGYSYDENNNVVIINSTITDSYTYVDTNVFELTSIPSATPNFIVLIKHNDAMTLAADFIYDDTTNSITINDTLVENDIVVVSYINKNIAPRVLAVGDVLAISYDYDTGGGEYQDGDDLEYGNVL